jgi:SOS response regulatory protein OraA/RecX
LELRRKLALSSFDRPLISRVLDSCKERGYLDDQRAAEQLTSQVVQRGGIGKLKFRAQLKERGCPDNLVGSCLERFAEEVDEGAMARELLVNRRQYFEHKRDRARQKLEERTDIDPRKLRMILRAKLGALVGNYLYARGFSGEEANRAGRRLVDELMALDEG